MSHMCYKGVTKGKLKKEGKMSYTKFENTGPIVTENSVKEIFIGEKEK